MAVRKRFADNVPGLLARPMNLDTRRIFVAATRMNDGKTTTCLGLTAALQAMGLHVVLETGGKAGNEGHGRKTSVRADGDVLSLNQPAGRGRRRHHGNRCRSVT